MITVYIVSLKKDEKRRGIISRECDRAGVAFEFFDAVYGKMLSPEEVARCYAGDRARQHAGKDLAPGELGCALSHVYIYESMIRRGETSAIILEDDAALEPHFGDVMRDLMLRQKESPEVIMLTPAVWYYGKTFGKLGDTTLHPIEHAWNTHGYYINLAAARRLHALNYPVFLVADFWNYLLKHKVLPVLCIVPPCVGLNETSVDSNIAAASGMRAVFKGGVFCKAMGFLRRRILMRCGILRRGL